MLTFNDQGILHTPEDIIEKSKLRNMEKMVRLNLELLERIGVIKIQRKLGGGIMKNEIISYVLVPLWRL